MSEFMYQHEHGQSQHKLQYFHQNDHSLLKIISLALRLAISFVA